MRSDGWGGTFQIWDVRETTIIGGGFFCVLSFKAVEKRNFVTFSTLFFDSKDPHNKITGSTSSRGFLYFAGIGNPRVLQNFRVLQKDRKGASLPLRCFFFRVLQSFVNEYMVVYGRWNTSKKKKAVGDYSLQSPRNANAATPSALLFFSANNFLLPCFEEGVQKLWTIKVRTEELKLARFPFLALCVP